MDTKQINLGETVLWRLSRNKTVLPILTLAAATALAGTVSAQISVPRYQSPIEAPQPQAPSLPTPTPITPNGTVVEYPVARVNDQIIDNTDYERAQRDLIEEAARTNESPAELAQHQKDLLRDMIDQQLLLSRGKELDINADTEVIRRLDDIRKQNHMDSMEDLEKAVRQQGISYEDFKANIKNNIITQEVVRDEVGRKLNLNAKQEQAYYDAHKQDFVQPEKVHLKEILIPTPDNPTDAQIAQAQAKANEVEAKLKAGAKFDDMVKQYSGGPNADKGGDLGDFCPTGSPASPNCSQLGSKVLDQPIFALQAGQWTAPIRTRQGFIIEEVTEHTPAGTPPLSAVEEQVQEAMYQEAIQPALRAYLTDLREKAFIDIAPGFVDTGASPRETKAVFAASTPPPVRKHVKKARLDNGRNSASVKAAAAQAGSSAAIPTSSASTKARIVKTSTSRKQKKPRREKIRYGQAPERSLPAAPEETLSAGADQGPGATSSLLPAPGAAMASASIPDTGTNPLTPTAHAEGKTRYSDRAPVEAKKKAAKQAKAVQKAAATPTPLTQEEKATQQTQSAALGLNGDTSKKKKKKRVKGEQKERLQQAPPAPAPPKPEQTPIPPKSVRDNGEPAVTPAPNPSTLPPATPPAPGTAVDTQPSTPTNPTPTPPQ